MIVEVHAPEPFPDEEFEQDKVPWVFLAGTIDNGDSYDWQGDVKPWLKSSQISRDFVILNPRCKSWDPSLTQSVENQRFTEQVRWELTGIESSHIAFFYFAPGSRSPISLLELGLAVSDLFKEVIVCAPPGYSKRGNVEIVAKRYGADFVEDINEAYLLLRTAINKVADELAEA